MDLLQMKLMYFKQRKNNLRNGKVYKFKKNQNLQKSLMTINRIIILRQLSSILDLNINKHYQ